MFYLYCSMHPEKCRTYIRHSVSWDYMCECVSMNYFFLSKVAIEGKKNNYLKEGNQILGKNHKIPPSPQNIESQLYFRTSVMSIKRNLFIHLMCSYIQKIFIRHHVTVSIINTRVPMMNNAEKHFGIKLELTTVILYTSHF